MSVARPIIVNASDFHRPFLKVIPAISPEITRTTVVARARLTRLGRNDDCRKQRTGLTEFASVQDIEYATNMDHFSIGLDVAFRFVIGPNIPSLGFYPRVQYTF